MNEGVRIFHLCRTGSGSILGWVCGFNQHGETFLEAWAMHVSTQCKSRAMPLGIQGQSLVIQFGLWPCSGASSPVGLHSIPVEGLWAILTESVSCWNQRSSLPLAFVFHSGQETRCL